MKRTTTSASSSNSFHDTFSARCAELGIPCWRIDLESNSMHEPEEPAAIVPLLRSTVVRSMIQNAATTLAQAEEPAPLKPLPGWVIAPFVYSENATRKTLSLALLLLDSVCESAQFATACASANLDPTRIRSMCQPLLRHGLADLEQTLSILKWMHEDLAARAQHARALDQLHEQLNHPTSTGGWDAMGLDIAKALIAAVEAKDPYTVGHGERVSILASRMARALKLDDEQVEYFRIAGLIHDVGKIAIPESVLTKRERLTAADIALIQRHVEIGHNVLKDIPLLGPALAGVLHHHERFDGFGYPHGLAGNEIPLIARVIAIADTFDAMSSSRSYRAALPRENVIEEITRCSGTQFDPALVELFLELDFALIDQLLTRQSTTRKAA